MNAIKHSDPLNAAEFARHIDIDWIALREQALRGVGEPIEVFALPVLTH